MNPPEVVLGASGLLDALEAEVVVAPFYVEDEVPVVGPGGVELEEAFGTDLLALLQHYQASGRAGELVEHPVLEPGATGPRSLLLLGVGDRGPVALRRAGAALARRVKGKGTVACSAASLVDDEGLTAFVEGLVLGSFGFHRRSTTPTGPVRRVELTGLPPEAEAAAELGRVRGRAGWESRTLALVPSNEKNPIWLAARAAEAADRHGLELRVWDERDLAEGGFGGILGVGRASDNPPRLVQLGYTPARLSRRTPHVVLVGKGITFDTGGLSIKPADGMMTMKRDMTGAGVVLAVLSALAEVDCPVRVTGLLACAENSVSGRAMRPGDVLRHYGGRTTEVTNTDAEGRLVLADALAYAVAELAPTVLVNIATLTGAMKVALGQRTGGYFATDEALADLLQGAADRSGEPLWRMPLVEDYAERIESSVADADNAGGGPGAVTAALFLRPFTGGVPWAHLDIASVGDSPVDAFEWSAGPTGFGSRLLLSWLGQRQPLAGVATSGRRRG